MVCGYKRTGKDTLYKMFNEEIEFNWVVYKNPISNVNFNITKVNRIGFSDKIREEVNQILNLTENFDYDKFKESERLKELAQVNQENKQQEKANKFYSEKN